MLIVKKNKEIASLVIDYLAKHICVVLRVSPDKNQLISGDIDVFIEKRYVKGFLDSIKVSLTSQDMTVRVKSCLCGYYIYIVGNQGSGFCKLDVHINEVYKNVPLLSYTQMLCQTYVDRNGLTWASLKNQAWIQYCFYILNNQLDNPKFLSAHNYLAAHTPETLVFSGRLFRGIFRVDIKSHPNLAKNVLYLQLLFKSFLSPFLSLQLNVRYINYVLRKRFLPVRELYFNGAISKSTRPVIRKYFRGQPLAFESSMDKETPLIKSVGPRELTEKELETECSRLVREFLKGI